MKSLTYFFAWIRTHNLVLYFLILLAFLSLAYFSFGTYRNFPYKIESDGKYYYQYLVSGYYDRDLNFTNNYKTPKYEWMRMNIDHYGLRNTRSPITRKPSNPFTIGPSILWTPFFLFAKLNAKFLNMVGVQVDVSPWGKYFQYTVMYSAVVYIVISLYLLYCLLIRYFESNRAILATWLLLISTNLFYYAIFEVSMSHVYDFFTYILFLFFFAENIRNPRPIIYLLLAIAGALHVLVRTQNILTVLLFSILLFVIPLINQKKLQSLWFIGVYGVVLFIGLLPIPLINNYLLGSPFAIPQGNNFLHLADPQILQVLFSERNGFFSHHPSLILGGVGFITFLYTIIKKTQNKKKSCFLLQYLLPLFCKYILIQLLLIGGRAIRLDKEGLFHPCRFLLSGLRT